MIVSIAATQLMADWYDDKLCKYKLWTSGKIGFQTEALQFIQVISNATKKMGCGISRPFRQQALAEHDFFCVVCDYIPQPISDVRNDGVGSLTVRSLAVNVTQPCCSKEQ